MLFQRALSVTARRIASPRVASIAAQRTFATTPLRAAAGHGAAPTPSVPAPGDKKIKSFSEITHELELVGPGAAPGTVPTDLEQAAGLERLEILGKMEGVDIFDMKPLDASRKGTVKDPIIVQSAGEEQYLGCSGSPADSHVVQWLTVSYTRPMERCPECGSVYKMEYIGQPIDAHAHEHHDPHHTVHKDPETMADYVKPEYWGYGPAA